MYERRLTKEMTVCVFLSWNPHHAFQLAVELSCKWLDQIHIITSRCFKQHLEGLETIVCDTVHWEWKKHSVFIAGQSQMKTKCVCTEDVMSNENTYDVLTWAVGSVWRVGGLPHTVVGTEVAVHCILSEAEAVFTMKGTVNALFFFRADELTIHWGVWLVTGCPCTCFMWYISGLEHSIL